MGWNVVFEDLRSKEEAFDWRGCRRLEIAELKLMMRVRRYHSSENSSPYVLHRCSAKPHQRKISPASDLLRSFKVISASRK